MAKQTINDHCISSRRWGGVLLLIVVTLLFGCEIEPEAQPDGAATIEDTIVTEEGACQIVLAVENTGDVPIEESNLVISITTDARQYYRRIIDTSGIPPDNTIGLVEEIMLGSPDETVDDEATTIEWESFS